MNLPFARAMYTDEALAAIVGHDPIPRTEIVKRVWEHIRANKLQDEKERRTINTDTKLQAICDGLSAVDMFELPRHVEKHIFPDPQVRRRLHVVPTMIVLAIALICAAAMSRSAENDALQFHDEATRLQTQAWDHWSLQRAMSARGEEHKAYLELLSPLARDPAQKVAIDQVRQQWTDRMEGYRKETESIKTRIGSLEKEARHRHAKGKAAHERRTRLAVGGLVMWLALGLCLLSALSGRSSAWYWGMGVGGVGMVICFSVLAV